MLLQEDKIYDIIKQYDKKSIAVSNLRQNGEKSW
jgi:hypothetical protein